MENEEQHSDDKNDRQQAEQQFREAKSADKSANGSTADESLLRTPEKAPKIPRDDSFKTCKASMPSPEIRRRLRKTPARNSILSGHKPYREVTSSGRKFNSRRKAASRQQRTPNGSITNLNGSADSNETFIRHERDLQYDPDSLDLNDSTHQRRQPKPIDDTTRPVELKQPSPTKKFSPIKKQQQQQQPQQQSQVSKRLSRQMPLTKAKPVPMPTSTPMPMAFAKPMPRPKPNPIHMTRYMSSTAKKPQPPVFKKPSSIISNSSVASSRRCLSQWNTPRLTRAQSFKSTAELEREYFSSLRSRS